MEKSASGCDSKVLIDLTQSYGELEIKLNLQPLPFCVFWEPERKLRYLYLDLVCSGVNGLLPTLLKLVGGVDNDDSVDRVAH